MRAGIDIGGTKAVIALINDDEQIVRKSRVPTGAPCKEVVERVVRELTALCGLEGLRLADLTFVGVGIPGTVDEKGETVLNAPNLHWENEPLAWFFEDACGVRPRVAQDTRAAAWAEARRMPEKKCVACVTLGTGIGCGIVMNGRIWNGAMGTAGEIGHIPVVPDGRECNCGRHGCMEAYASGTGITRMAREKGIADSSEELFSLAEQGSEAAREILRQAVTYAAMSICAMMNTLSPDAVLFSGGLSAQQEWYVKPLITKIRSMAYKQELGEGLFLGMASLGGDAPAIGAAFLDGAYGGLK